MIGLVIRAALFVLVINHLVTPCVTLRGYAGDGSKSPSGEVHTYKDPRARALQHTMSSTIPDSKPKKGLGISAWGIIFVILGMIFAGVGVYYISMCYPILCKKERNYDIIDMAAV